MNGQKQAKITIMTMNIRVMALNSGQVTPFISPLTALLRKTNLNTHFKIYYYSDKTPFRHLGHLVMMAWRPVGFRKASCSRSGIKRVKDEKVLNTSSKIKTFDVVIVIFVSTTKLLFERLIMNTLFKVQNIFLEVQ